MHQIKVNRALRTSDVGRYPASAAAMLDAIPPDVIGALSSKQLALLLDATWDACQASKRIALTQALSEGAIWDGSRMREIALAHR